MNPTTNGAPAPSPAASPAGQPGDAGGARALTGEAAIQNALERAFLPDAAAQTPAGAPAGTPAPAATVPGSAAAEPAKIISLEQAPQVQPAAEPQWNPDQLAWFKLRNEAKTEEEIATVEAQAPTFSTEQTEWLNAQANLEQRAQEAGRTVEQQTAFEAAEAAKGKAYSQAELEQRIQERVHKLQEENTSLRQQLAAKPVAIAPTADNPFIHVNDLGTLRTEFANAKAGHELVLSLSEDLADAPQDVERQLRAMSANNPEAAKAFVNDEGQEDYSVGKMRQVLRGLRRSFEGKLAAAPKRAEDIKTNDIAEARATALFPWLGKAEEPLAQQFTQMETQFPVLRSVPGWKYWLACSLQKNQEFVSAMRKNGGLPTLAGQPAMTGRPRPILPRTARNGGAAPQNRPGDRTKRAVASLRENPNDEKRLEKFFQEAGFAEG